MLICQNCHQSLSIGIPSISYGQNLILGLSETCGWSQEFCHIVSFKKKHGLTGKKIKVAVMDTGILEHKELKIQEHINFTKGGPMDVHGTFVSGIIAAQPNNFGICGIAPNVELYDVRVLDSNGLSDGYKNINSALNWCYDNGMDLINCSFGSFMPPKDLDIWKKGIVVAASGNCGKPEIDYPARIDEVVAVGSISKDGQQSAFSNFGLFLDLLAPGDEIVSCGKNDSIITSSGTSFAAPFVVGIFALLLEYGIKDKQELIDKTKKIFEGGDI